MPGSDGLFDFVDHRDITGHITSLALVPKAASSCSEGI